MCTTLSFNITPLRTVEDLKATTNLFRAYTKSPDIDRAFQDFVNEMATMPRKYVPSIGELLLARNFQREPIGCVGLRPFEPSGSGCCEMKHLYTLPTVRGFGVGKALVITIVDIAGTLEYEEIKLATLPSIGAAVGPYKQVGFVATEAYYDTPTVETIFLVHSLKDFETQTLEL